MKRWFPLTCCLASALAASPLMRETVAPKVPIASDRELFDAFALDRPELAAVQAAVIKGDFAAAKAALLAHYRQRRAPVWFLNWWERPAQSTNAPPAALVQAADRILNHEFSLAGSRAKFGPKIDWRYLPARLPDGSTDFQLPLLLYINRMTWLRDLLGPAYWVTGDERYAQEWAAVVQDWVESNPAPSVFDERLAPNAWRRLTTAYSIPVWISALNYFLQSPATTPDALAAFFKGIIQKARFTIRNPETVNRLLVQLDAVHAAASCFPELREAARWREWTLDELDRFIEDEIYPDGAARELAPGYQSVMLASLRNIAALAAANHMPLRYGAREALARMADSLADTMLPDGTLPAFGDTWAPAFIAGDLALAVGFYPPEKGRARQERLRYRATLGREGEPPPYASTASPWAGTYVMRAGAFTNLAARLAARSGVVTPGAGWRPTDAALAFRCGPFGTDHQHEDKLSFVLYAFGARLLDEMGVYSYASTSWREYFRSTAAHNTVLVDGLGQNRRARRETWVATKPLEGNWASDDAFDFVSGIHDDGWGPQNLRDIRQRREIFFAKPDYWVLHDLLLGTGTHSYEVLHHMPPGNSARVHDQTKVAFTDNLRRPNLAIYPVDTDVEVQVLQGWSVNPTDPTSPRHGWFSPTLQKVEASPCFIHRRRAPAPQVIESILLPAPPADMPDISTERLVVNDASGRPLPRTDVCALRINTRAGTDLYVNDLRIESLLDARGLPKRIQAGRLGEIEFAGKLLFMRLGAADTPLLLRHVGGPPPTRAGTEIRAAGR
jgi:hypothetical protein